MSGKIAISVEGLGKAYRIGMEEQRHETFVGACAAFLRSPFKNFREVRGLGNFDGAEDASDIIWALKDVSFEVKHGEAVGIIGRNGAGKSTLLKILSRITEPTRGRAEIHGRVASLLEVGTGFHPDLTGRENVYLNGTILGMKKSEVDAKFDQIVDFSGVEKFMDTPVKRYSSGMRVRLAFSVAAHLEPEILIVDEVLAVGDAEFQKKCLGKMENAASQGRTVLFVSHNMEAVLTLCGRGVILNDGGVSFIGDAPEAVHRYQHASLGPAENGQSHVIWAGPPSNGKYSVDKLEVLDLDGRPKRGLQTWDDVRFRIHYTAPEDLKAGSAILEIRDYRDTRLAVMDSGLALPLKAGSHFVDCVVPRLPLAAGDYFIGLGLALSNAQWLWRNANAGIIVVGGRDVFASGRPPVHSRMLFAVPHQWSASPTR
ncbi:MAG TPA: ABC transporter ATP-binding protein [Verrucomicrobiae bacterium]|jgi:lipopolysaccharide transport system ATP-binding protein